MGPARFLYGKLVASIIGMRNYSGLNLDLRLGPPIRWVLGECFSMESLPLA